MATSVFDAVRAKFIDDLTTEEKQLLDSCRDAEGFVKYLQGQEMVHHDTSYSRRTSDFCKPFITGVERLSKALDVLCNVKPEILAALWGGLRIVLHVATGFQEFFDAIKSSLETIGANLSRAKLYESLFPKKPAVRDCLTGLFSAIFEFFLDVKRLYRDATEGKKRKFLPRRLAITLKAVLSAFQEDSKTTENAILLILDRLDREALAAGLEDNRTAYSKQDTEIQAAKAHRDRGAAEILDQASARKIQNAWRIKEEALWHEQQLVNKALTDSVAEEARRSLFSWLAPVSSDDHHDAALNLRYPGTCEWILNAPQFIDWAQDVTWALWIHGITGAGKTVLLASIIEFVRDNICPDEALSYFYFNHTNSGSQDVRSFLATTIVSLAGQSNTYLKSLLNHVNNARAAGRSPTVYLLQECFAISLQHFESIYIIVDAIDEYADVESLMAQLLSLGGKKGLEKVKLLVTSRTNTSIEEQFADSGEDYLAMQLEPSLTNSDIVKYIEGEVKKMIVGRKLKLRDPTLRQEIIKKLSEKSDGMFQWVKCQLDVIRSLKSDKAIRGALERLPKSLNETYVRALRRLMQSHEDEEVVQAQRLFRWLVHSARPLGLNELVEVIAVDFDQEGFDISAVVTEPSELLKFGESLIASGGQKRQYLQLSHFSVKEFLLSEYCMHEVPQFYMERVRSNAELAQVCLTALLFKEFASQDTKDHSAPDQCPLLYDYAVSHWGTHYHVAHGSDGCPSQLAKSLLVSDPVHPNFIYMRRYLGKASDYLPIHYCSELGLVYFLQEILDSGVEIDVESEPYGTPLNFAARHDRPLVNEFLLDHGADVNKANRSVNGRPGNNCLHWAMDEDRVSLVSERLVRYIAETPGLEIDTLGGTRGLQRPLHYAACANRVDLLDVLLSCGSAIDGLDDGGRTPLHVAVEEQALDSVRYLLDQGASMVRADKCDSMREGGFGFSISVLPTSITEARWEVATLIRRHKSANSTSTHLGFKLGEAVQHGRLEAVQELLDSWYPWSAPHKTQANENNHQDLQITVAELEAKTGTMFGALDIALHGRHLQIAIALLEKMALLFEHQLNQPSTSAGLGVHAIIIRQQPDIPFCESVWSDCALYISILLGHLRAALTLLGSRDPSSLLRVVPDPMAVPSIPTEIQAIVHLGLSSRDDAIDALGQLHGAQSYADGNTSRPQPAMTLEETAHHFCEKARMLWKSKRNRKSAFEEFFNSNSETRSACQDTPPLPAMTDSGTTEILTLLNNLRIDTNALDRAGCTPLYWAHVRSWTEVQSHLESLGGELFAEPERGLEQVRCSILELLHGLDSPDEPSNSFASNSLDLSRKWDWDNLGRYLYFSGHDDEAVRAFEAGTVFDTKVPGDVPAFHYFNCDSCFSEYSYDNLLRGRRFVPLGLVNIDLCEKCAGVLGDGRLEIPSSAWVKSQQAMYEDEQVAFRRIEETIDGVVVKDKAKADWKRERAIQSRADIQKWITQLKEYWENGSLVGQLQKYTEARAELASWLGSEQGKKALLALKDVERW